MADRSGFGPYKAFGDFIQKAREKRSTTFTQSNAERHATAAGLSLVKQGKLSELERGWNSSPDPELFRQLSTLYSIPYRLIVREWTRVRYGIDAPAMLSPEELQERPAPPVEGFKWLPLLHQPIAAGQPLTIQRDEQDEVLAFRQRDRKRRPRLVDPVFMKVGDNQHSMSDTINPGDVVLINQSEERRRDPQQGSMFAVNYGPLMHGEEGGAIKMIEINRRRKELILHSKNPDKKAYPTLTFSLDEEQEQRSIVEILKGEVVWYGRYV